MVYHLISYHKSVTKGQCGKTSSTKRTINIGANIEQKPWQPTVRKGQISAEHILGKPSYNTIPSYLGPNVVDSKKKSSPAYSMGKRITTKCDRSELGPAQFDIRRLCNKGPQAAPAFTFKNRTTDNKKFQSPSANEYSTTYAFKSTVKATPIFSFTKRPGVINTLPIPAPNVYNLPPVFGTAVESRVKAAPAFSMLARDYSRKIPPSILPGPGEYEINYRYFQKRSPQFSLGRKPKEMFHDFIKPGPAHHCPEKYFKHKSVPAHSFGIQHTPYLGVRKAHLIAEYKASNKSHWIL